MLTTESSLPFFSLLHPAYEVCGDQKQEATRRITATAISILQTYLARDLSLFDAQVGDQACQIRALWIIRSTHEIDSEANSAIKQFKSQELTDSMTLPPSICFLLFSAYTVKGNNRTVLYEQNGLVRYKNKEAPRSILGVAKSQKELTAFCVQLLKQAKMIVNEMSMSYVRNLAKNLSNSRQEIIERAFMAPLPGKLQQLSAYHLSEIVFIELERAHVPILLKVRKPRDVEMHCANHLIYRLNDESQSYLLGNFERTEEIFFVIEAISTQTDSIKIDSGITAAGGLMEVLRLHLAQHPLAPAMTEKALEDFTKVVGEAEMLRIHEQKQRAELIGCSRDNYTIFRIVHIFAGQLKSL